MMLLIVVLFAIQAIVEEHCVRYMDQEEEKHFESISDSVTVYSDNDSGID